MVKNSKDNSLLYKTSLMKNFVFACSILICNMSYSNEILHFTLCNQTNKDLNYSINNKKYFKGFGKFSNPNISSYFKFKGKISAHKCIGPWSSLDSSKNRKKSINVIDFTINNKTFILTSPIPMISCAINSGTPKGFYYLNPTSLNRKSINYKVKFVIKSDRSTFWENTTVNYRLTGEDAAMWTWMCNLNNSIY